MPSNFSTEKSLNVAVVGFSPLRAELLISALSRLQPGGFVFRVLPQSLLEVTAAQLGDSATLAFGDTLPLKSSLFSAIQRLRGEEFYWQPIHLCLSSPPQANRAEEWALHFHPLPPDVRDLSEALKRARPLSQPRRREMVASALSLLVEDLNRLTRAQETTTAVEPDRLKQALTNVLMDIDSTMDDELVALREQVETVASAPVVEMMEAERLFPIVSEVEGRLRDNGGPERLLSHLHTLNNVLRLAVYQPDDGSVALPAILSRLEALEARGLEELPAGLREEHRHPVQTLRTLLLSSSEADASEDFKEQLREQTARLSLLTTAVARPLSEFGGQMEVKRIIVIEDDPDWRRMIVESLRRFIVSPGVSVQEAGTVAEAEQLLKKGGPALALVDLGLPTEENSELALDAGLSLIKQFTGSDIHGRRFQHRFIVLTASEYYTDAVREALGFGVSPMNYLQKNPRTWESELKAQVRLSLHAPAARQPHIEVFKRTGRIARIEGLEFKLEYPLWCVLASLAESRRGVWCEPEKIVSRLYWNYSLNPESRSRETDALDPEERIALQLPHYISDLRKRLDEAYRQALHSPPPEEILSFESDAGYRLNAYARVLDRVEEHFRLSHRPSVLVVEDNVEWGRQIVAELTRRGFEPRYARYISEARQMMLKEMTDLVSLDLELPETEAEWLSGKTDERYTVEFLRFLRRQNSQLPVAILTAAPWRDDAMLEILRQGVRVDDYLSKHWDAPLTRLANSLARLWQETLMETQILAWDVASPLYPIRIDEEQGTLVDVAGFPVKPAGKGRDILRTLSATPNVYVSRAELLEVVYGEDDDEPDDLDRALNQHLKRLRRTITDATGGTIQGDHIICGERGIYWLRGIVQ